MAEKALRVLVTGGSGFIGSHFVRLLLHTRPAWSVVNFDLLTYAGRANNLRDLEHMPNYTFIQVRGYWRECLRCVFWRPRCTRSRKVEHSLKRQAVRVKPGVFKDD